MPRDVAGHGNGLRAAYAALIPGEESADGIGGTRSGPKARTGGRRRTGWWTETAHLPSSLPCPVRRKGVQPRWAHQEQARQARRRIGWNA